MSVVSQLQLVTQGIWHGEKAVLSAGLWCRSCSFLVVFGDLQSGGCSLLGTRIETARANGSECTGPTVLHDGS